MTKKSKFIIQICVLILVVLAIGYYFFNEFYLQKKNVSEAEVVSLEQIFEFKVVRQDLSQEQIDRYKDEFDQYVMQILAAEDNFNLGAFNGIGMIKKILHDFEGAQDAWEYLNAKRPDNSLSFFNLANLYAEDLKDNQKAEENFLKALENSAGETGNEQYYRGIVNFYKYFYPEKKEQIEKILLGALSTPEYAQSQDILALLATYYQENNQKQKAIEYWQKVLELNPDNAAVMGEIEKLK